MSTRNIVPRLDGEGNIGTALKNWLKGWFKDLFVSGSLTNGTQSVTVAEIVAGASYFGKNYKSAESEGEDTTTSQAYVQKLRLTTDDLPSGTYRIGWSFEGQGESLVDSFQARVQLNNTTDLMNLSRESKDASDYIQYSGFKHSALSGVNDIDLDYQSSGGDTMKIRKARLEIWRVE